MNHIIETPSGRGRLVGPGFDEPVSYSLRVIEEVLNARDHDDPKDTLPGMRSVDGTVSFDAPSNGPGVTMEKFVLHLQDGRKISVSCIGSGQIRATGGFF